MGFRLIVGVHPLRRHDLVGVVIGLTMGCRQYVCDPVGIGWVVARKARCEPRGPVIVGHQDTGLMVTYIRGPLTGAIDRHYLTALQIAATALSKRSTF